MSQVVGVGLRGMGSELVQSDSRGLAISQEIEAEGDYSEQRELKDLAVGSRCRL